MCVAWLIVVGINWIMVPFSFFILPSILISFFFLSLFTLTSDLCYFMYMYMCAHAVDVHVHCTCAYMNFCKSLHTESNTILNLAVPPVCLSHVC